MKSKEYKVLNEFSSESLEKSLNDAARRGWEVHTVMPLGHRLVAVMERLSEE